MNFTKENLLLYAVTDRSWCQTQALYEQVEAALKGGVTCVQLREKNLDEASFWQEAEQIKSLCHHYNVPFIINDNVDLAIKCQADGVHVGQSDMAAQRVREKVGPNMIIGVSAHTVEEALQAQENGADYLGVGSAFSTSTKQDVTVIAKETIRAITEAVDIPVVAIGGINQQNIAKLKGTKVDGIAVVSAIFAAQDIEKACVELRALSSEMVKSCN